MIVIPSPHNWTIIRVKEVAVDDGGVMRFLRGATANEIAGIVPAVAHRNCSTPAVCRGIPARRVQGTGVMHCRITGAKLVTNELDIA